MADMPTALERREFLYGKPKKTPDYAGLGDKYEQAGNLNDAAECYEKLADPQRQQKLEGLLARGIKEGNHFLLNRLANTIPVTATTPSATAPTESAAARVGRRRGIWRSRSPTP